MRRREFVGLAGGLLAWPLTARAQQLERVRRIGLLVGLSENDPGMKPRLAALHQELKTLGWIAGGNVRIERRHAPGGARAGELARELVAMQPDVILAHTVSVAAALQNETRTI